MKGANAGQRGGAMLIALAIMLLLTVAAILAVRTAQTDIDLSFNQLEVDQAFYVAEAGLTKAYHELNIDNDWTDGIPAEPFEGGIFSVALIDSNTDLALFDTVILRSAGSVGQATANLQALVVPEYWQPFQYAMFGDSAVVMDNNTCTDSYNSDSGSYVATSELTDGDVASNGTVEFVHTAVVGGDASSALPSGVSVCATCTVYGDTSTNVEPFDVAPVADSVYQWAEAVSPAPDGLAGTYDFDDLTDSLGLSINNTVTLSGGVYYFTDITLANNSSLQVASGEKVIIYLDGDLTVGNNSLVNSLGEAGDLMIYSRGSLLTLGESVEMHAAFYGPTADVSMSNNCQYYGSIVSHSASAVNAACVHYDRSLGQVKGGKTGVMKMIAWRQL